MSKYTLCKSNSGRVWHILDGYTTYCGKTIGDYWEFDEHDGEHKLCRACVKELDSYLAVTTGEEFDGEDYDEPASPIERTNPLQTW